MLNLQSQLEILQFAIANTESLISNTQRIPKAAFENATEIYMWIEKLETQKLQMKKQIIHEAIKNTEPLPKEFVHDDH